ncbi:hypothetical protein INS49_009389 [Diaporthe citri]|uniref:uncharacterized protein n=1 Tax=Diaporthe citri TaxID=83186 RepID=UPI001C81AEF2|nr:uncharacterized protein INS49_009389 [Diaporthe citri]KAG6361165.1 hypothetical protein INS49_009389 [Diaporthe citri]
MASSLALTLEQKQCPVCHTQEGLQRCGGCRAVYYCGREHQASHRNSHKHACNAMKKAFEALHRTEHKLRALQQADLLFLAEQVGRFWDIQETRDNIRARFALVETMILHFKSANAVLDSLVHLMHMLDLCQSDNLGMRWVAPALYLRLGWDQQCYDFLKWCATKGERIRYYRWDEKDEPPLRFDGADVLESPEGMWTGPLIQLGHAACVMLIKVRVVLDLQHMLNATRALEGVMPREIIDEIRGSSLVSSVVALRKDIIRASTERTAELLRLVKHQVTVLFRTIAIYNRAFWPALVDSDSRPERRADAYPPGSAEEAAVAVMHNREAWMETPGSIEVIKSLMKVA